MRTHILYVVIGVLLAGNVALLLKKTPLPSNIVPQKTEQHDLPGRVVLLDSLVLRRWSDNEIVQPDFGRPTVLLFFSRLNCASCVDRAVDFLTAHAIPAVDTYVVSIDVNDPAERQAYDARFLRSLSFYSLDVVHRTPELDIGLPALIVVNDHREILFAKQILPSDDVQGGYLFWKRINFLYTLLAL